MKEALEKALNHPIWAEHKIGDLYIMDGIKGFKIAYYPIFEDGKTGEQYTEPRALVEKPARFNGVMGIDFKEVPLRYLTRQNSIR